MKRVLLRPVPKQAILTFAGIFWMIAGFNVVRIGFECMSQAHGWTNPLALGIATVVFLLFLLLIFIPMYRKNSTRIVENDKPASIWTAYELRGYLIVIFMIALGVTARALLKHYPIIIGTFYLGLGAALFIGGVCFFYRIVEYNSKRSLEKAPTN